MSTDRENPTTSASELFYKQDSSTSNLTSQFFEVYFSTEEQLYRNMNTQV